MPSSIKTTYCTQVNMVLRKKHSTELAVLELVDRITQELDKGHTPINIFLDLSKAFDTLDPSTQIKHYGIKNSALDLFKSYLSNRKQYVDFLNNRSTYARQVFPRGQYWDHYYL